MLDEGLAQLARALPPVDAARQDGAAGAQAVQLRAIDSRGRRTVVAQGFGRVDDAAPRANDQLVRGAQVLARTVVDGAHGVRHGHVLRPGAAGDTGVAHAGLLQLAVEEELVLRALGDAEAAVPV